MLLPELPARVVEATEKIYLAEIYFYQQNHNQSTGLRPVVRAHKHCCCKAFQGEKETEIQESRKHYLLRAITHFHPIHRGIGTQTIN